jgi:hypothetical protein
MDTDQEFIRLHGPVQLASAEVSCWKCHRSTPVHALLAADVEEFTPGEEPMRLEQPTFVYDISPDALPPTVKATAAKVAPNFKPLFSRTVGETSWANACVHCGLLQGAFFLHSEPDGPFFGGPEDFDGAKVLVSEQGFDVDGASYSV